MVWKNNLFIGVIVTLTILLKFKATVKEPFTICIESMNN